MSLTGRSVRHQLERRRSRFWTDDAVDYVGRVPAILHAVRGVDLVVHVVRFDEENVLFDAASLDMCVMAVLGGSEPGGRASVDGSDVQVVGEADDPNGHWVPQRAVPPE